VAPKKGPAKRARFVNGKKTRGGKKCLEKKGGRQKKVARARRTTFRRRKEINPKKDPKTT